MPALLMESLMNQLSLLLIWGSGSKPEAVMKRETLFYAASVVWMAPQRAVGSGQLA